MIQLTKILDAWGSPVFEAVLKAEIEQFRADQLPLQQGLSVTSHVADRPHKAIIIGVSDDADFIRVKTGIFYLGITPGCSCADDPTPIEEQTEYCEVQIEINRMTAEATVTLLDSQSDSR